MEVATGSNNSNTPFQREIREWQRVDPNTGALLTGRLEADRWINGPSNAYGKVVDSQDIAQPNGIQHTKRKQLEVLQSRTSSGSLQVVRAQTVQTSSSRGWTSTSLTKNGNLCSLNNGNNKTTQSIIEGHRFASPLTNGHHYNKDYDHASENSDFLTNGHQHNSRISHSNVTNSLTEFPQINGSNNNHHHKNQQMSSSQSPQMIASSTTPSLKLSTLMKSSVLTNGGRISPHSIASTESLTSVVGSTYNTLHNRHHHHHHHQPHDSILDDETQSILVSANSDTFKYKSRLKTVQPTGLDSYVGGGHQISSSLSSKIRSQQIQSYSTSRNERETLAMTSESNASQLNQHLNRGRSVSTDDLAITDWNPTISDDDEPTEWRRVSKIRRSFQFPKNSTNGNSSGSPKATRPPDLPENSISVSRIRAELENGRRLNTAMRNNHVDLVALDNILNGGGSQAITTTANGSAPSSPCLETPSDVKNMKTTSSTFLTAESLKEIRGKLKRLSDESLYREDFITQNDLDKRSEKNQNGYMIQKPIVLEDSQTVQLSSFPSSTARATFQLRMKHQADQKHTTNSLENRNKLRDTNSAEWHLRRKSYGFEKMTPPADGSMYRHENSTDSGIGRSSELTNWSPTETQPRGTVITFGEPEMKTSPKTVVTLVGLEKNEPLMTKPLVQRRYHSAVSELAEIKRHSVDESKFVRDNLRKVFDTKTSIHINGLYIKDANEIPDDYNRKPKRVEFCKTEVHFAAESGRVNIVETDGKPPSTNNFRRRRRASGGNSIANSYLEAINCGIPVIHFGDEQIDSLTLTDDTNSVKSNVTVSIPITAITKPPEPLFNKNILEDEEDDQSYSADEISLRGILKNKPIRPKPYHLGENIEPKQSFWSAQLKPVNSDDGESENEKSTESNVNAGVTITEVATIMPVAERVRIVEERKADHSGYSTKINLNLSNSSYSWETNDIASKFHHSHDEYSNKKLFAERPPSIRPKIDQNDEGLKSTSLIIRTMRSANQFDEAISSLSKSCSTRTTPEIGTALKTATSKLISNLQSTITKSNSDNSIYSNNHRTTLKPKYSSSLNGDVTLDDADQNNGSVHNSVIRQAFDRHITTSAFNFNRNTLRKPIAAPRVKIIGSSNAINHQLSQLRRMYDAADESDDSVRADEEVKRFLSGDGDREMTEEKASITSGSWSRIKAKRATKKITITIQEIKGVLDLPKENIIETDLHSPTETNIDDKIHAPVAQQRIISDAQTSTKRTNKLSNSKIANSKPKGPLTVVTGGARKLKEHELSYFGVRPSVVSGKWKLSSDKPDLLRHSPETKVTTNSPKLFEGPIYENLKQPATIQYNRKTDFQRDEKILNEMTEDADQTLKTVSNDVSRRKQNRDTKRTPQPLDTIEEKRSSNQSAVQKMSKAKTNTSSDSFQRPCRLSSASSNESIPRTPTSVRNAKKNLTPNLKKSSASGRNCQGSHSRSSSHDRSRASSSEDLGVSKRSEDIRRIRRTKPKETKDKDISNKHHHQSTTTSRSSLEHPSTQRSRRISIDSEERRRSLSKRHNHDTAPKKLSTRRSSGSSEHENHHLSKSASTFGTKTSSSDPHNHHHSQRSTSATENSVHKLKTCSQTTTTNGIAATTSSSSNRRERGHTRK